MSDDILEDAPDAPDDSEPTDDGPEPAQAGEQLDPEAEVRP